MTAEPSTGAAFQIVKGWHDIDWHAVHRKVRRLQARIEKRDTRSGETASRYVRKFGLSRMTRNRPIRFLGEGVMETFPSYPTKSGEVT
jgi:hypothetical protein